MVATLSPPPKLQFLDAAGQPMAGGKLYTYAAGTTTPLVTYADSSEAVNNTNPIILDSRGEANVWLGLLSYKFKLTTPADVEIWTADNVTTGTAAAVTAVESYLASSTGANLVGFQSTGAGAVVTTVGAVLRREQTVEDFGAVGDGVTNDNAAFVAMLAATGGTIRMLHKEYKVNQLNITGYAQVTIIGEAMPQPNAALTQLQNGTVFIGGIYVEANNVHVENFGLDFGTGRTVTAVDGIVLNAKPGEIGNVAYVKSVSSLGIGGTFLSHGVLVQGYEYGTVQDVFSANHGYGVVVKGRNTIIDTIHIRDVIQAGVFVKGDYGIPAGGVGDGSVVRVIVNNVITNLQATNTVATGVWITPPTAPASQVLVSNVHQLYGKTPVSVFSSAAGPYYANLVGVTNVMSESAQYGFIMTGVTNNVQINNLTAINPLTGTAIYMDLTTANYTINNVNIVVNNASITSDTCMSLYGSGSFDNITVTNGFRQMKIGLNQADLTYIKTGVISGDCFIQNEGSLAAFGINGAAVSVGDPAKLEILPGSAVKLSGKFDLTASSNKFFCNLPIYALRDALYACAGIDSTNAIVTIAVRLNDFQLSVEPTLPAGFKSVDLSNILFTR